MAEQMIDIVCVNTVVYHLKSFVLSSREILLNNGAGDATELFVNAAAGQSCVVSNNIKCLQVRSYNFKRSLVVTINSRRVT